MQAIATAMMNLIAQAIRVQKVNVQNTLPQKRIVQPTKKPITNMRKYILNPILSLGNAIINSGINLINMNHYLRVNVSYSTKRDVVAILLDNILIIMLTITLIRVVNIQYPNSLYTICSVLGIYFGAVLYTLHKRKY